MIFNSGIFVFFWLSGNGDYGVLRFADVQNWESVEANVHVVNADRGHSLPKFYWGHE